MVCTDGLIETGGHDLDTGWARLRSVLENHEGRTLEELADELVQAVHGPGSHHTTGPLADRREDDIAVLLISRERIDRPARPRAARRMSVAQAEPERIAAARQQLRELLHDWADDEQVDSAVLHGLRDGDQCARPHRRQRPAGGRGDLRRRRPGGCGWRSPTPATSCRTSGAPARLASSGRGLLLMEMLADTWGVDPRGEGKSIWFELYESPAPDKDPCPPSEPE